MKRAVLLVLILMFSVSLFAQSGAAPAGKYFLTSMNIEGVEILDAFKELGLDASSSYFEIISGGKFRMVMFDEETEGTYRMNGNTIIFTSDDEDVEAKIEGKRITIKDEDSQMVFERK